MNGDFIWKKDTIVRDLIYVYRGEVLLVDKAKLVDPSCGRTKIRKREFFGEEQLLSKHRNKKFKKYIVAHSQIVYITVFPKQLMVEVFKSFNENFPILLQLEDPKIILQESDPLAEKKKKWKKCILEKKTSEN